MSLLSNIWLNSYYKQEKTRRALGLTPEEMEMHLAGSSGVRAAGGYRHYHEIYGRDSPPVARGIAQFPTTSTTSVSSQVPSSPLSSSNALASLSRPSDFMDNDVPLTFREKLSRDLRRF